jgi:hypothetical protein
LLAEHPDARALVVEGEKTAEVARKVVGKAYVVLTWAGGASNAANVEWSILEGRDVWLWPDNDITEPKAGPKAMRKAAHLLIDADAKSVHPFHLPGAHARPFQPCQPFR